MKLAHKIIVLGKSKAGKKQLINRLLNRPFEEVHNAITGTLFAAFSISKKNEDETTYNFWTVGGQIKYKSIGMAYYGESTMVLYCVDLSEELDIDMIKQTISSYKEKCPDGKFIIVGTKSDLLDTPPEENPGLYPEAEKQLQRILDSLDEYAVTGYCTSARNGYTFTQDDIVNLCSSNDTPNNSSTSIVDDFDPSADNITPEAPPFMKKHMNVILGCTLAFGTAGALLGAGLGVGMCVTGAIPTFGLSVLAGYCAIPIMSATFALASAVVGLLVGLAIAAYREYKDNRSGFFRSATDNLGNSPLLTDSFDYFAENLSYN